jgi:hypothetical protein
MVGPGFERIEFFFDVGNAKVDLGVTNKRDFEVSPNL